MMVYLPSVNEMNLSHLLLVKCDLRITNGFVGLLRQMIGAYMLAIDR